MSLPLFIILLLTLWVIGSSNPTNVVIGFLFITCAFSTSISLHSEWNGYFLVLTYVGGLLIIIFYLSSFTISSNLSPLLVGGLLPLSLLEETSYSSTTFSSLNLWSLPSLSLFFSIILIFFCCFLISQLLFIESSLRLL